MGNTLETDNRRKEQKNNRVDETTSLHAEDPDPHSHLSTGSFRPLVFINEREKESEK